MAGKTACIADVGFSLLHGFKQVALFWGVWLCPSVDEQLRCCTVKMIVRIKFLPALTYGISVAVNKDELAYPHSSARPSVPCGIRTPSSCFSTHTQFSGDLLWTMVQ